MSTKSADGTAAPDGQQREPTLAEVLRKVRKRKQAYRGMPASGAPGPGQGKEVLEKNHGS